MCWFQCLLKKKRRNFVRYLGALTHTEHRLWHFFSSVWIRTLCNISSAWSLLSAAQSNEDVFYASFLYLSLCLLKVNKLMLCWFTLSAEKFFLLWPTSEIQDIYILWMESCACSQHGMSTLIGFYGWRDASQTLIISWNLLIFSGGCVVFSCDCVERKKKRLFDASDNCCSLIWQISYLSVLTNLPLSGLSSTGIYFNVCRYSNVQQLQTDGDVKFSYLSYFLEAVLFQLFLVYI